MKLNQLVFFSLLISSGLFITSCNDDTPTETAGTVTLEFEHLFDGDAFELGTKYTTSNGDEFDANKLLYYVSNISLSNDDGTNTYEVPESYYLVDITDAESLELDLSDIPNGEYTKVDFLIGVDSARNVDGAQEGALDVANGMFWSWNMGYIFFKMEGMVQDSIEFRYHIGGFRSTANNVKQIAASVPTGSPIVVNGSTSTAHFMVDIAEFFKNPVDFDAVATPDVAMPNASSLIISDNYKDMFMLDHVHNE